MTIETFRAEQHGAGHGLLLRAAPSATLADLDPATTIRALASAGFLLFRGFHPDITEFSAFTRAHSDRITLDPARQFEGKVAQKVDAGTDAVGLHIENGNSPFAPDLTWFYCRTAASAGSQTTVCDGYRVWDELSPTARDAFAGQDIVYSRDVAAPAWKAFVRHHHGSTAPDESITVDDMRALATGPGRTTITEHDDGAIHYVYQVPAVHPTLFGERPSFANSILGPSYNYQKPLITFADGTDLPAELLAEVRSVTESMTEDLDWQDGDVALIDNTRVMHGRRAILDPARAIFNAQSFLAEKLR